MDKSKWIISPLTSFDAYGISRFSLNFHSRLDEARYRRSAVLLSASHVRFAVSIGAFLILAYAPIDAVMYEWGDFKYTLGMRMLVVLVVVPAMILYVAFTFTKSYVRLSQVVGPLLLISGGAVFAAAAYGTHPTVVLYEQLTIIMASIYAFFFSGLLFSRALVASVVINAAFSVAVWSVQIDFVLGVVTEMSRFTIMALLAVAAYQKELMARQVFINDRRERKRVTSRLRRDARHLKWLAQLAQFLRHEVKQPIAQISTCLDLIKLRGKLDSDVEKYTANATFAVQHVWNLIDTASRATDAEAFVRQGEAQSVDVNKVVRRAIDGFSQSYSGIDFALTEMAAARVRGDASLIYEAINNIISNAVSFSREGGVVHVEIVRVPGGLVGVEVSNEGPTLPEAGQEKLFEPFHSTRSGDSSGHHGLGLYLVRLVAEHHNGRAAITNLPDMSGVKAAMYLPIME